MKFDSELKTLNVERARNKRTQIIVCSISSSSAASLKALFAFV